MSAVHGTVYINVCTCIHACHELGQRPTPSHNPEDIIFAHCKISGEDYYILLLHVHVITNKYTHIQYD